MRIDIYTKVVLTVIAVLLGMLVLKPAVSPAPVQAQADYSDIFIEPATTVVRAPDGTGTYQGKVVIDRRNGDVYGFPTDTNAPYPFTTTTSQPPVSKPIYLGQFDFSAMGAAKAKALRR
jgi:hypothetical protein